MKDSLFRRLAPVLFCLIGIGFASTAIAADCLRYEPAPVSLTGTIAMKEAYGPPGYGEDPAHDAKEQYPVLILASPICVAGYPDDDMNSKNEVDQTAVQMVFIGSRLAPQLIGQKVTVSGNLFHRSSGHHHTNVLIKISEFAGHK